MSWNKSSRNNIGGCVELNWKKASFSNGGGSCVELAHDADVGVVRDSKNPDGGQLPVRITDLVAFARR
jgi:hypothetical protein